MDIKTSGELSDILEVLRQMSMFETKIAALYSTCALTWVEDRQFWLDIWRDEISHALYINNIIEIVERKPEVFEKGRPFNVFEVQTVVSYITVTIEQIKNGRSQKNRFFLLLTIWKMDFSKTNIVRS